MGVSLFTRMVNRETLLTITQYGLQSAFSEIERKSHSVTSSGNPIELDMSTFYKVKGIGKETTINSKINIFVEDGKISRVEDKWDGKLPDSGIANVSKHWSNIINPFFWAHYAFGWFYSAIVLVHETRIWTMVRGYEDSFRPLVTFPASIYRNSQILSKHANTSPSRPSAASMPSPSPKQSASPTTPKKTQSAATRSCRTTAGVTAPPENHLSFERTTQPDYHA